MNHSRNASEINADSLSKNRLLQQLDNTSAVGAITALSIGLIAISFAANFIKLSEDELSPNSTIFNRLWIASVAH